MMKLCVLLGRSKKARCFSAWMIRLRSFRATSHTIAACPPKPWRRPGPTRRSSKLSSKKFLLQANSEVGCVWRGTTAFKLWCASFMGFMVLSMQLSAMELSSGSRFSEKRSAFVSYPGEEKENPAFQRRQSVRDFSALDNSLVTRPLTSERTCSPVCCEPIIECGVRTLAGQIVLAADMFTSCFGAHLARPQQADEQADDE